LASAIERLWPYHWHEGDAALAVASGADLRLEIKGPLNLHTLLLVSPGNDAAAGLIPSSSSPAKVNSVRGFRRVTATKYEVDVDVKEPGYLVFAEGYHPMWRAFIPGTDTVSSTPSYGLVNSFYLTRTGQYTVALEFVGQRSAHYGFLISLFTAVAIGAVIFSRTRAGRPMARNARVLLVRARKGLELLSKKVKHWGRGRLAS